MDHPWTYPAVHWAENEPVRVAVAAVDVAIAAVAAADDVVLAMVAIEH